MTDTQGADAPQDGDNRLVRRQFAATLRRARASVGQQVASGLGARWRTDDVGTDLTSGVVADECVRLAATLAFAIEMNDADLFCDEIGWLARMFQIRGYDGSRFLPRIFEAYAQACATLGPPETVRALVTPVLDAARRCVLPDGTPPDEADHAG